MQIDALAPTYVSLRACESSHADYHAGDRRHLMIDDIYLHIYEDQCVPIYLIKIVFTFYCNLEDWNYPKYMGIIVVRFL